MLQLLVFAETVGTFSTLDALSKLAELVALHGVYAMLVFFLFYQQRKTLRDFTTAAPENREYLRTVHRGAVVTTYVLMAVATPIWVYATFFYHPKTVLWGDVANLKQMTGEPKQPGTVFVEQQITPEQREVKFYTNLQSDINDPGKVTLYWALVEDGQYTEIPLILLHRYKELVRSEVQLDPNSQSTPLQLKDIPQTWRFTVKLGTWAAVQANSFEFQYSPDTKDPDRSVGTMRLLRNGKGEDVKLEKVARLRMPGRDLPRSVLAWLKPPSVFAQNPARQNTAAAADRVLPWLGSKDLKQQLAAQQTLVSSDSIHWDGVRKVLADPQATQDHTLLVHNLAGVIHSMPKAADVPADIRIKVAQESYKAGDFNTSKTLFDTLSDKDLDNDVTNYYFRGVTRLQTGDYKAATTDLQKYVVKAPNSNAKAVAQRTLVIANEKASKSTSTIR
jgi:hypothetical protein